MAVPSGLSSVAMIERTLESPWTEVLIFGQELTGGLIGAQPLCGAFGDRHLADELDVGRALARGVLKDVRVERDDVRVDLQQQDLRRRLVLGILRLGVGKAGDEPDQRTGSDQPELLAHDAGGIAKLAGHVAPAHLLLRTSAVGHHQTRQNRRARPTGVTLLFLTTVLPAEATTGGESASRAFVDGLRAAGHRVVLVGYKRRGSELRPGLDDRSAGERHIETDTAGAAALGWLAKALALRLPYSVAKYRSRRYRRAVREAIAEVQPDLLICDHAQASAGLPPGDLGVPMIYLAHNVEHRHYRDAAARSRGPLRLLNRREARHMLALELDLAARARNIWALTEADGLVLEALGGGPVRVFALPPTAAPPAPVEPQHDVVMLGTWTWGPTRRGCAGSSTTSIHSCPPARASRWRDAGPRRLPAGARGRLHGLCR